MCPPEAKRKEKEAPSQLPVIGWREWVALPDMSVPSIKVKVDTGARTSSLHAFDLEYFTRDGIDMVRFEVHPEQRSEESAVSVEAPLIDKRFVRSSTGKAHERAVIHTTVELLGKSMVVELTLTRRDEMGFRMLLGRQAIRGRFLVDAGRSFLNGRRLKGKRRPNHSRGKP